MRHLALLFGLSCIVLACASGCARTSGSNGASLPATVDDPATTRPVLGPTAPGSPDLDADGVKISTFLGGAHRRFYGSGPVPEKLELIWKSRIGSGKTGGPGGGVTWSGTGWTGQPTLVREDGRDYLLIGGYDHNLRKVDAQTGELVWTYEFDDVIKGTNTIVGDPSTDTTESPALVVVGSRRGFPLSMGAASIAPVRAVTLSDGVEQWRLPVPRTKSYSQDADSSPLYLNGVLYTAVESAIMFALDPYRTQPWSGSWSRPVELFRSPLLYAAEDPGKHGGNLVLEASPAFLGGRIYVSAGSGHVYGLDPEDLTVEWDFRTRSDLDGTSVATQDGCLLVAVEKQYIPGHGGVLKLDPTKPPADAVVWFCPTGDAHLADWEGGVIGSVAINDEYDPDGTRPPLAAFRAIDGNLYVVGHAAVDGAVDGPNLEPDLPTPVVVLKDRIGAAISTPVIVDDHIVTAGYDGAVRVYRIEYAEETDSGSSGTVLTARDGRRVGVAVSEVARFDGAGSFESTPIVWRGRIYIGSRDGYLYCLGDSSARP